MHTSTLKRWIHGSSTGLAAVRAELQDDPDQFITFNDFVQAMAIRSIRLDRKVPLPLIREAVQRAEEEYGVQYPFARKHTTYLFDDDIVIRIGDDVIVQVTGKYRRNQLITPVVELYAEDLVYDCGPYPVRYQPFTYQDRSVVFDPRVRFGEPLVEPSRYTVDELVVAAKTEGSVLGAAKAYGVDAVEVETALRFNDWLLGIAA